MSPLPVRVETNASDLPSGEKSGRDSVAGFATSNRASPPVDGTVQISPPETNAIVFPSGERDGSENGGCGGGKGGTATRTASPASMPVCMRAIITIRARDLVATASPALPHVQWKKVSS